MSKPLSFLAVEEPAVTVSQDGQVITARIIRTIEQQFFTLAEAAIFIRVSESLLYKLVSDGKLKPARIGAKLVFSKESLVAFMTRAVKSPVVLRKATGDE